MLRYLLSLGLVMVAAGYSPAHAQAFDATRLSMKLRAGSSFGEIARSNDNKRVLGLGLGGYLPFRGGFLTADVGYDLFQGSRHDETRLNGPIFDAKGNTGNAGGVPYVLSNRSSLDLRKQLFRGFSVRAGYLAPIAGSVAWQAGITLDRYQTYYEVAQTLIPVSGIDELGSDGQKYPNYRYYEGRASVSSYTKLTPGFYGGVVFQLADPWRLEVNARSVGFTKVGYTPFTYSGKAGEFSTSTKRGLALEFVFSMKI